MSDRRSILKSLMMAPLALFSPKKRDHLVIAWKNVDTPDKDIEYLFVFTTSSNDIVSIGLNKDLQVVDMQKSAGARCFRIPKHAPTAKLRAEVSFYDKTSLEQKSATKSFDWRTVLEKKKEIWGPGSKDEA